MSKIIPKFDKLVNELLNSIKFQTDDFVDAWNSIGKTTFVISGNAYNTEDKDIWEVKLYDLIQKYKEVCQNAHDPAGMPPFNSANEKIAKSALINHLNKTPKKYKSKLNAYKGSLMGFYNKFIRPHINQSHRIKLAAHRQKG